MKAYRNIRLCTKDCLCLYVCPTHATDTETGKIDINKCTGCGLCADSCPSHAISLIPDEMPNQRGKHVLVLETLDKIFKSKVMQKQIAFNLERKCNNELEKKLLKAISISNQVMGEDLVREAGFMLPQSKKGIAILNFIMNKETDDNFPREEVIKLIKKFK